jgi:Protein of unknown function (DUF4232)
VAQQTTRPCLARNLSWWNAHRDAGGSFFFFRVALGNHGPTPCLLVGAPSVTADVMGRTVTAKLVTGSYPADRPMRPGEAVSFSLYTRAVCNGLSTTLPRGVVVTWAGARGALHAVIPDFKPTCSLMVGRFYVEPRGS